MSIIIGIDNGLDGGVVFLSGDGKVLAKYVMPTIGNKINGKRSYVVPEMARMILRHCDEDTKAYLELAQAMPKQGVSSMFSIGFGFGLWQGVLTALAIPFEVVGPRAWQKVMFEGVDKTDTKKASALVANRLSPQTDWKATERCKTQHDGLTDAFCLAEYGRTKIHL